MVDESCIPPCDAEPAVPVIAGTSTSGDVCAEMRALCSACGGTGDVHSIDGEWRGSCDCEASAWSREQPHTPGAARQGGEHDKTTDAT